MNPVRRVAIITGAARGLGAAIAADLLEDGCDVVLADIDPAVDEAARALDGRAGGRAIGCRMDVRDRTEFARTIDRAERTLGPVAILVNNAARTVSRSIWEIDAEEWDDLMAVNLRSVLFGCQLVGLRMRQRGRGRIINLASFAGQQPSPASGAHYATSKAGVLMLTRLFARELAADGVTVNAVAPSAIHGPLLDAVPPAVADTLRATIPAGRFGDPADVCAAVRYLASDAAGYVTGTTLDVNGGRLMR